MRELRDELETFVCRGRFADALQRILERYLTNLDGSRQDAVWVSGFFGSGKSHLLKMLAHLWVNTKFDDGATARSLVAGRLPSEVEHTLRELEVRGQRIGKPLVAAAGSLLGGNVGHVRLSVLSILLRACGFPEQYPQARFCFWLRDNGLLGRGAGSCRGRGQGLGWGTQQPLCEPCHREGTHRRGSDLRCGRQGGQAAPVQPVPAAEGRHHRPTSSSRPPSKRLRPDGEIPLTILVLDEVQQYINEVRKTVRQRSQSWQRQSRPGLESRMLLVASGQSALSAGTKALQWLSDRFRIAVQLTDAEVEAVTREVLLQKKATATPAIQEMFEGHAGEVSRHLHGTRLAVRHGRPTEPCRRLPVAPNPSDVSGRPAFRPRTRPARKASSGLSSESCTIHSRRSRRGPSER